MIRDNWTNEIAAILLLVSSLLLVFGREKDEDEFITRLRLESLQWATFLNCLMMLFAILFLYTFNFLYAMIVNIYSILILFIVHFHLKMRSLKREIE